MFIRKKKINNNEYAYLVENRYHKKKKQSRQKTSKYLGKVINLGNSNKQTQASTINEAIINELNRFGFKESKNKLIKNGIEIDLGTFQVIEGSKKICLELNEGFLCNLTLTNLLNFNSQNLNQKEIIHNFADAFVSAGINLHYESFINIFNTQNTIKP
jgi:hypothetical protein